MKTCMVSEAASLSGERVLNFKGNSGFISASVSCDQVNCFSSASCLRSEAQYISESRLCIILHGSIN